MLNGRISSNRLQTSPEQAPSSSGTSPGACRTLLHGPGRIPHHRPGLKVDGETNLWKDPLELHKDKEATEARRVRREEPHAAGGVFTGSSLT